MKKAIKEKGAKKKDAVVEAAVAALAPLLGKVAGAVGGKAAAGAAAKGGLGAAAKGMAKDAAIDAAAELGGKGARAVTSLPGKVMDAGKAEVESETEE